MFHLVRECLLGLKSESARLLLQSWKHGQTSGEGSLFQENFKIQKKKRGKTRFLDNLLSAYSGNISAYFGESAAYFSVPSSGHNEKRCAGLARFWVLLIGLLGMQALSYVLSSGGEICLGRRVPCGR